MCFEDWSPVAAFSSYLKEFRRTPMNLLKSFLRICLLSVFRHRDVHYFVCPFLNVDKFVLYYRRLEGILPRLSGKLGFFDS